MIDGRQNISVHRPQHESTQTLEVEMAILRSASSVVSTVIME